MYTKCCAVLQRSRAKDDKTSTSDMTVEHDSDSQQIGQGMRIHFETLVNGYGKDDLIPVYPENNTFNFYLNREVKSAETNNVNDAEQCFANDSRQSGNEYGRAARSQVQRQLWTEM